MTSRSVRLLALPGTFAGLLLTATSDARAQSIFETSRAPAGGATGAESRGDWTMGQAPTSDFDRQGMPVGRDGRPLTRAEIIRRRSAAAMAEERREAARTRAGRS
ncbi:hypothetical protein [Roseomonas indoligenes]|uniref:Uncharacterized protein n=1 Tax=Roseomonas indoligenes TaxID=2820811 RepID=A0A940MYB2_9PROT|nr:hypothetical protein [Pararoseomonas indoligenes]MBP0493074.1 hypothetical protein [Pararoseomonas indoligenes]